MWNNKTGWCLCGGSSHSAHSPIRWGLESLHYPVNPFCCLFPVLQLWLPSLQQNRPTESCRHSRERCQVEIQSLGVCVKPRCPLSSWHCCSFLVLLQAGQICFALRVTLWLLACNSAELRPCPRDLHMLTGHMDRAPKGCWSLSRSLKR